MDKNLIKNKGGDANIILLAMMTVIMGFAMLTIGNYIYFSVAGSADAGTQIIDRGASASGIANFSNATFNVTTGELFVITYGTSIYTFEFNTSSYTNESYVTSANAIRVNAPIIFNKAQITTVADNLTAAINANASTSALWTASNTSGLITITADNVGNSIWNSVTFSETVINASITSQPSGGRAVISGQTTQNTLNDYATVVFPLFGLALMILGFAVLFITIKKSFGTGEGR